MDRDKARNSVVRTCLRLRGGRETRVDRNVLRSAFPRGLDDRSLEAQLLELLERSNDGIFSCRPLDGGDCMVRRVVRKELMPVAAPSILLASAHGAPIARQRASVIA